MSFKIIAGDLSEDVSNNSLYENFMLIRSIQSVDIVTEENKKSLLGAAGWGALGGLVLGSVGLLAGVLSGGNSKEICFIGTLADGRKFMATADTKTFRKIANLAMSSKSTVYQTQQEVQQLQPTPRLSTIIDAEIVGEAMQIESSLDHDGFCTNCGSPVKVSWKFCPKCATKNEFL